jgi:hypothetical protein
MEMNCKTVERELTVSLAGELDPTARGRRSGPWSGPSSAICRGAWCSTYPA